jgi:GNAT superfamily N-acetyltransferase
MNKIALIQRLFGNRPHNCAMDAREYKRGGNPKNPGQFSSSGSSASSPAPKKKAKPKKAKAEGSATPAKPRPKANVSEQAHAAAKAKVAENAAKPKKPAKTKAEKAAPKAGASAKADVTVSANNMRARALEDGKEIGFVTGEIKDGALCIHKSTLSSREHGKGYGVAMYQALVDKALGQGLRVESDWEPTEQATRMYGALERRGYTVEKRKPGQELTKKPFTVTKGPGGEKPAPKEKAPVKPKAKKPTQAERVTKLNEQYTNAMGAKPSRYRTSEAGSAEKSVPAPKAEAPTQKTSSHDVGHRVSFTVPAIVGNGKAIRASRGGIVQSIDDKGRLRVLDHTGSLHTLDPSEITSSSGAVPGEKERIQRLDALMAASKPAKKTPAKKAATPKPKKTEAEAEPKTKAAPKKTAKPRKPKLTAERDSPTPSKFWEIGY